ncbi:hypothetical protein H2202_001882 [Exophiala xenobiotica]|nr:hypothetical protein H2202_001882 [Exophiala xenobiotica]KAK5197920.1 hypothetical protein LTR92_002165 [Exophiala xenobiotica]KAK5210259.1 hypothetical protein LTR41_003927 [Exophiala xenobiotica]KAK5228526.1 hypothetical protein LTR72_002410 [Exophiala xenobiotica]KAK5238406.1 hypothetical protein LTR47_000149 [Exophiala xenobiotica]
MAELRPSRTADIYTRVEDYLNDKIQSAADLDQVDSLLLRVHEQQGLLRQQLEDARKSHREVQARVEQRSQELASRAEAFHLQKADVDRRLQSLARTNVSDDAASRIEARMGKVRNLEIAQGYLDLVRRMNTLSSQVKDNLHSQPGVSVQAYLGLRSLLKKVQHAQEAAEGAAPQLVYTFVRQCMDLHNEVKMALEADLQETLEEMKWPSKELKLLGNVSEKWNTQVKLLLELQDPDLIAAFADRDTSSFSPATEPVVLLPLEVIVQPLAARFRYHFYGERPTNRLDKPEYFLNHVLDLLDRHSGFMSDMLDPILDERAATFEFLEAIYTDAVSAFITALLPMVLAKCLSFLPQISQQPQLLSHFIHELMAFDTAIRDTWGYVPIPRMLTDWRGVTWTILNTHGYFGPWLEVEKDFALSRYRAIRDAPDSGDIDFDADSIQTKPTKGAIRVNDLLETITDRYRGLSSFSQKMRFLLDIQLSIFDDYHNHLHGALQAYLVSSHTAGRLLQGQTEADAFGLKGLESLTKIYGSAEFLERKMSDWSDDVFFLELWEELQYRAKANSSGNASVGTDLRVDEVASKTSDTIRSNGRDNDADTDGGGLFDQTALAYRRLRDRSEEEIIRAFDVNLRAALDPYAKYAQWSSLAATPSDFASMSPSPSLDGFLQTTSVLLGFLADTLAPGSLRRITRRYCASVQRRIYDNILMYHTFSAAGASQLKRDLSAIKESIEKSTKLRGVIGGSMKRLEDAVFLLSLDAATIVNASSDDGDEDGWGFGEEEAGPSTENAHAASTGNDFDEKEWGLWDAEKLVFQSNEAARKALADMGLYHLTEAEARNILKRRAELNG